MYNEERTVYTLLNRVDAVTLNDIDIEIIIVDDCSTDLSVHQVQRYIIDNNADHVTLLYSTTNQGKGAAIHRGLAAARGNFILIQDADLEYDPEDYHDLIKAVKKENADVVYGSRFKGGKPHRMLFYWHSIGNHILTALCNMVTNLNLSDMECCYKLIRTDIAKSLDLREKRFGLEPEITIKLSRIPNIKIFEVSVSYYGRTYAEGKNINYKDGLRAIYCILKYGLLRM